MVSLALHFEGPAGFGPFIRNDGSSLARVKTLPNMKWNVTRP